MTEGIKKLIDVLSSSDGFNWTGTSIAMTKSRSDAQRLIEQGAVKFGQESPWDKWPTIYEMPKEGGFIRIGGRPDNLRFLKIKL